MLPAESTGSAPRQKRHRVAFRLTALSADEFDLVRDDLEVSALLTVLLIVLVVRDAGQQDPVAFLQVLLPPDGELVPAAMLANI